MKDEEKDTGRIEAFSDGVFAIQWPAYLSFVTSFCTILIMWGNHHEVFRLVRRTDTAFMLANGFLLMPLITIGICTVLWIFWAFTMKRAVLD